MLPRDYWDASIRHGHVKRDATVSEDYALVMMMMMMMIWNNASSASRSSCSIQIKYIHIDNGVVAQIYRQIMRETMRERH